MGLRIGVLTAGGDCPGLNAVIRGVVRTANSCYDATVVGFQDGWTVSSTIFVFSFMTMKASTRSSTKVAPF